ncbi:MAG: cation:dicarboxylase symporter family transporter, partial [Actinomycetes bacterium]
RYLMCELLLVLGTSSSESALPSLIDKMERAGCPKSIVVLVVPTGYSFNLDGTAIYLTMASLFIADVMGSPMSVSQQLTGLRPSPTRRVSGRRLWGAPAGRGETVTGKPGPVYEPLMRLVGLTGRPSDRSPS